MTNAENAQESVLDHAMQSIAVGSKSFAAASRLFDPETRRSAVMRSPVTRTSEEAAS